MNPIHFVIGYVLLTALFWLGNRNVAVKKPRNSAFKWFVWTTTWISFAFMMIGLPADGFTIRDLIGITLVSPFSYPMLFAAEMDVLVKIGIGVAPCVAAWIGYRLAVRHNRTRPAKVGKNDPRPRNGATKPSHPPTEP